MYQRPKTYQFIDVTIVDVYHRAYVIEYAAMAVLAKELRCGLAPLSAAPCCCYVCGRRALDFLRRVQITHQLHS